MREVVLAAPFSSQDAAKANFRVSATLTAIDGDGLVPGLSDCSRTKDLGGRMAAVLGDGQTAVKAATTVSISDARTQREAAVKLFGLLPEVLAIATANATLATDLGLGGQVAVLPTDVDPRPLGSLPPLPPTVPRSTEPDPANPSGGGGSIVQLSTYFSGYGAQHFTDDVTFITGSWTQPKGTCDGKRTTAFGAWVGIQNAVNLQQIGTAVECARGSLRPRYFVWYEMFPKPPVRIGIRAAPGDKFTASVSRAGDRWTLTIRNRTSRDDFSTVERRATPGFLALWIDEAPSSQVGEPGEHVLPLTRVTPVTMTGCFATSGGVRRAIGNPGWAHVRFDMVTTSGAAKAVTSGLTAGGTAFRSTWRHY